MAQRKIRVLIAKVGLDGHDRGAKIVARALMDAGMEVIYTGLRQTADQVVVAALQENVDVLGLSFLSGDHMVLVPKVIKGLKEMKVENLLTIIGGVILKHQIPELLKLGVDQVFLPGADPKKIVQYVKENVNRTE